MSGKADNEETKRERNALFPSLLHQALAAAISPLLNVFPMKVSFEGGMNVS